MEEVARVEGGADGDTVEFHPGSAEARDGSFLRTEEAFDGGGAEGDDNHGGNDGDLGSQVGQAGLHFGAGGFTISAGASWHIGAALENIRDIDLFTGEFHGCEHFCEEFTSETDEGFAFFVFIGARSFADKHETGLGITYSEDDLGA